MPTIAIPGRLAWLELSRDGVAFVPFGGIVDISLETSTDALDVTTRDDGRTRRFIPNHSDSTMEATALWEGRDPGQRLVRRAAEDGVVFWFSLGMQREDGSTVYSGRAFVRRAKSAGPLDSPATFEMTLRVTGPIGIEQLLSSAEGNIPSSVGVPPSEAPVEAPAFEPAPIYYWSIEPGIAGGRIKPTIGDVDIIVGGSSPGSVGARTSPRGSKMLDLPITADPETAILSSNVPTTAMMCFGAWVTVDGNAPGSDKHVIFGSNLSDGGSSLSPQVLTSSSGMTGIGGVFHGSTPAPGTPVAFGTVHYVLLNFSATTDAISASWDGGPFAAVPATGGNPRSNTNARLSLGSLANTTGFSFNGAQGDIAIWDVNLTDADAAEVFARISVDAFAPEPPPPPPAVFPETGLVAYWRWEDDLIDAAGGHVGSSTTPGFTAGFKDRGLRLQAGDTCVRTQAMPPLSTAMSFFGWFKPMAGGQTQGCIVSKTDLASHQGDWSFGMHAGSSHNQLTLRWNNASQTLNTSAQLPSGTWHLIGFTFDGSTVRIFCDNVQVASTSFAGTFDNSFPDVWFGAYYQPIYGCDGVLDEAGLWDRALTADERDELWNGGVGAFY